MTCLVLYNMSVSNLGMNLSFIVNKNKKLINI